MFIDSAQIKVRAGRGGDGCVSFRREKFVPRGGPNGGDGGRGGSVILSVDPGLNTLLNLQHLKLVRAERGGNGQGSNKTGAGASDVVVLVPPGTIVKDADTGELLGDLVDAGATMVVARGGMGGRGNARFKTASNRAPRRADAGRPGDERTLDLELKLLADLGLVGMPNAGKSTLLARISAARPRIADYPFTTLEPQLGVVAAPGDESKTLVAADIPGLIEGAHLGAGLGIQFLRHVERCRALAHLVDLTDPTPVAARVAVIRDELAAHSATLATRPWVLVGSKLDAVSERAQATAELAHCAHELQVPHALMSAVSGEGVDRLLHLLFTIVEEREAGHD